MNFHQKLVKEFTSSVNTESSIVDAPCVNITYNSRETLLKKLNRFAGTYRGICHKGVVKKV